ncbi:thiamine-phosphate kinase [Pelosinus propionicus]|uniref:Thiamine-monophosphate kinase n=1 Tax=Pelosinus propionicus DSM 13327 TaxID=1123291 RepID=A0A1I4M346_9FIRM|nr:thiamine-phosphate kinase [Pelosinus propionicus]SFL97387.1 thiamine-phosphate kinase [Pelosinus propionicus DSM 13327]
MDFKQLGEFALIDLIKVDAIHNKDNVVIGIGDDAAALIPAPHQLQLVTTDMLVEMVHFDLSTTSAWQLGYKSIAVNLSDIAAMGGKPTHVVISIALPSYLSVDFVVSLYEGMKEICHEFGVNIVGGDTVASPNGLVINVTAMGEVDPKNLQRRSGASVGDLVVVTGALGDSGCGLELLQQGTWTEHEFFQPLVLRHVTPRPQVAAGAMLASFGSTSMNDISDGLASEVNEIAAASQVGIRIYAKMIPLSAEVCAAAGALGKDGLEYALYGGEDYQLVFTIPSQQLSLISQADLGIKLTVIGEVIEQRHGVLLVDEEGVELQLEPKGYDHFRQ